MSHVYVAYLKENSAFAADLIRQIEDAGFTVRPDREQQPDVGSDALDQAIRSAVAVVAVMSPAARASEQMAYQWIFALGAGVTVIPLLLEQTALHPRMRALEQLDFTATDSQPWGKLLGLLQAARTRAPRRLPSLLVRRDPGDHAPRPGQLPANPPAVGHVPQDEQSRAPLDEMGDGLDDPDETERLLAATESESRETRLHAATRLGDVGGRKAIQGLVKLLRDEDLRVRDAAASALGKMRAASAVVGLLETVRLGRPGPFSGTKDNVVIATAIREIGEPAVPVLIDALSDEDWRIRLYVVDLLGEIGEADAVPALAEALRDVVWRVRWRAADALGKMGNVDAVADLLALLGDENKDVRVSAAWALGRIGSETAVPGLVELLHDREWRVRWSAAEALWEIGGPAVPVLLDALRDKDEYVRRAVVRALVEIGEPAIPGLVEALGQTNWDVRWAAAAALQEIGDAGVPALVGALDHANWQTTWAAAETLKRIGTPEALTAVERWRKGREGETPPVDDGPAAADDVAGGDAAGSDAAEEAEPSPDGSASDAVEPPGDTRGQ